MIAIYETAYPRIKPHLNYKELAEVFTPTEEELALLNAKTKKTMPISRLGFMILLKCYQYLGRPVKLLTVDESIKKHIAQKLDIDLASNLSLYNKKIRTRHIKIIRNYLEINTDKNIRRQSMKAVALNAATTKENLADIVNCLIEDIFKSKFELPSFRKVVRLARAARVVVNNNNYRQINSHLSENQKKLIDIILELAENDINDPLLSWAALKKEPKKPTTHNVKEFVLYVMAMKALRQKVNINLSFISPTRIEQLRDEAMATDMAAMKKMRTLKRSALVTILIYMKTTAAIDDLVLIFIKWVKNIEAQAKNKLQVYRLKQAAKTDGFILLLYNTLLALKNNEAACEKIQEIEKHLDGKADDIIEQCREYLGLTGEHHIAWMLKPYNNKRYVFFQLLENLTIYSSSNDKAIEKSLKFIMHHRHSHKEWIKLDPEKSSILPDLNLLSDEWFRIVTGLKRGKDISINKINRHYYEIAVFTVLMGDLSCGDAYVEDGFIYDDPTKQFITWEEFDKEVDAYCDLAKLPKDQEKFIESSQAKLRETAEKVDKNYHNNPYLIIENGLPILKKLPKKKEPANFEKIKQMIMAEMPITNIVDLIIDVEKWLNLSTHFKPHSGNEIKIKDYPSRFVATALSYGCNMGPTQTERSLSKYTRKQIAWLFNHHATDQKLIKTIKIIINRYNAFDLPKYWGTGDSQSVDGSFVDMYKQNLLAAHHIRYGRYGGVGYYHVSDMYIALFSNLISCGAHESIYLLDGIVENDSDVQPKKVHGDSWAQSEVMFGLSTLLSIVVMPRIKQFKHLHYYKASSSDNYDNIDELFTEKSIDWELIKTHYHDMLRVAISIIKGKVKASAVLRKLCSKSRKNKLYFAFRELGRIERTVFLLNYINDPELRRMIQAATCKSEEFNQFIGWIRFGDGGMISENIRFNQKKIIKFNQLLANMAIFHTVVHQTKAINNIRSRGIDVPDEILAGFAPYWTDHLNRFGMFQLDMQKNRDEIEYNLKH